MLNNKEAIGVDLIKNITELQVEMCNNFPYENHTRMHTFIDNMCSSIKTAIANYWITHNEHSLAYDINEERLLLEHLLKDMKSSNECYMVSNRDARLAYRTINSFFDAINEFFYENEFIYVI